MKKLILPIILLAAVFLIAACAPKTVYICPDGSSVEDKAMCKPVPTYVPDSAQQEPAKTEEPPVVDTVVKEKSLTPDAKALFDKLAKADNIRFNYFTSLDPNVQNAYTVSRYRMKIELINKATFSPTENYDTVYLDFRNQDASAYCERQSTNTCPDKDKKFDVSYNDYKIKTPYQWVDFIEEASLTGRSKQINGKTAKEVSFKAAGKDGTMWVDSFFGEPLEVYYDGVSYQFQNTYVNDAKDADLYHPLSS